MAERSRHSDALVAGLGEIGGPIADQLAQRWEVARLDIDVDPDIDKTEILHVCYPFEIEDFLGTTLNYIDRFSPEIVIVHSTIAPGTTKAIQEKSSDVGVFFSPVKGKHATMSEHLLKYTKFLSGPEALFERAKNHLEGAGFKVEKMEPAEALEVAKLLETTYFGLMIAWTQEMERYARWAGSDFKSVLRFMDEVEFLPTNYFPGFIGGHCVMPNINLLRSAREASFLDTIEESNERFVSEEDRKE